MYIFVDGRLATDIFEKKLQKINTTVLGMSVFLGLYAFGFQGIIYGPLLIGIGHIIYEMLNELSFDDDNNLVYEAVIVPNPGESVAETYASPVKSNN